MSTVPPLASSPSPLARRQHTVLPDGWRVGRVLGTGGSATVYEGHDETGNRCAVKILHPQLMLDRSHTDRLRLEAKLLASLQHPAFLKLLGEGVTDDGLPYIRMELLDGTPLIEPDGPSTPKPLSEVIRVVRAVLEALAEMHRFGAIHRDIKPGNLHVTAAGHLKVIDLGIARVQGSEGLTITGMAVGTPGFMAPEQAFSAAEGIGPSTDIFAVGATAIVLLHGGPARRGQALLEAATCPFPTTQELGVGGPREVLEVLDRAVRYAPDERYQSAIEMLAALDRALAPAAEHEGQESEAFLDDPTIVRSKLSRDEDPSRDDSTSGRPSADTLVDPVDRRAPPAPHAFPVQGGVTAPPPPPRASTGPLGAARAVIKKVTIPTKPLPARAIASGDPSPLTATATATATAKRTRPNRAAPPPLPASALKREVSSEALTKGAPVLVTPPAFVPAPAPTVRPPATILRRDPVRWLLSAFLAAVDAARNAILRSLARRGVDTSTRDGGPDDPTPSSSPAVSESNAGASDFSSSRPNASG